MAWKFLAANPRRAGPHVPAGLRLYAVGDVHGRADLLSELLVRIDQDLKQRPADRSVQVFLGDYIDRGPSSRQVIDLLIARRQAHDVMCLKGNHEACALEVLRDPAALSEWENLGGGNTLLSYGIIPSQRDGSRSRREVATAFRQALSGSHLDFFKDLKLSFTCGDFFFAHAGARPGIPLHKQSEEDLLWIRDDFLLHEEDFGKVVVHGHTPAREPDVRPNRINIDTGAYATGRLTCLVLEGNQIRFL